MARIVVSWADGNFKLFGSKIRNMHAKFPKALPRIVNQVGGRAKTQVIRNLTAQTGLPKKTIVRAIGDPRKAHAGRLSYEMKTRGGDIRLKFLNPVQEKAGVTATPWGKRTLYPRTFMVPGHFFGHVVRNLGRGKRKDGSFGQRITTVHSGMYIPKEMTSGATAKAFAETAAPLLKERVDAVLKTLAP